MFKTFEVLKIKLFGHEPVAKVTQKKLAQIIRRDYGNCAIEIEQKLQKVISDSLSGKSRISAAILKLANKDLNAIDRLVELSNTDCRDVLAPAEYPGYSKVAFRDISKSDKKRLYISDWKEYSTWLNKI